MGSGRRAVRMPLESPLGKWTFDENMRVERYAEGIRTIVGMLQSSY